MRAVMPSTMPFETLKTTTSGIMLIPMQRSAPKRLRRAEDFFSMRGKISRSANKSEERIVIAFCRLSFQKQPVQEQQVPGFRSLLCSAHHLKKTTARHALQAQAFFYSGKQKKK